MSPDRKVILPKVRDILVEALSLRPEEVTAEARIVENLGAESIDLLDLRFRIEKAFGFRISNENLVSAFGADITPTEFRRRFTVEALCDYIGRRLEEAIA